MTGWTDVIGWTLVHFVWEGTLIALVTALVLAALRAASAHLRYLVACGGLLLSLTAVAITPAVLRREDGQVSTVVARVAEAPDGIARPAHPATAPRVSAVQMPGTAGFERMNMARALSAFVIIWAAGVLLLTLRLAIGGWRVRRLHANALAEPASAWLATATRIAARLGIDRIVHVTDSSAVETPTVVGWLRPVVLLPVAALTNLTPGQVEAILAHELAHVRRHDFLANLLQTVAETMLFYHPGVWWLSSRIRIEREHCCDDIAVDICGDPAGYAEALTTVAERARRHVVDAAAQAVSPLGLAATGGSLLCRVRRLLRPPADPGRRPPKTTFVAGAIVLLIVLVGMRLIVVAQTAPGRPPEPQPETMTDRIGPLDINRMLGFDLFPGPAHYATDDPKGARAWDVTVAYPGGEMAFLGFTARGLLRYAYHLDGLPVVDGPSWVDTESRTIRAETSAVTPDDEDLREAIRVALEGQDGLSIRRDSRLFAVYGLEVATPGTLGPNLRPSTAECFDSSRDRLETIGPTLYARGQQMQFCGIDSRIRGLRGYRVTLAEFARSLRGFGMGQVDDASEEREVIDQTGLTGVYDFELNLGLLPLAAIASAHPYLAVGFGPMIRTFPQAIEEQLGLRLVPSETPREVAVILTATQAVQANAAEPERWVARLRPDHDK